MRLTLKGIKYHFPSKKLTPAEDICADKLCTEASHERLPELSLPDSGREEILNYCQKAGLPFYPYLSEAAFSDVEKVIINCMNGFPAENVDKLIYGAKILLLILNHPSAVFALDSNDAEGISAASPCIKDNCCFSVLLLPSVFPLSYNRVLSLGIYPYTKREKVAVFSAHEVICLYDSVIDAKPYQGHMLRFVSKNEYFDKFVRFDTVSGSLHSLSEITEYAEKCFGKKFSSVKAGVCGFGSRLSMSDSLRNEISALYFDDSCGQMNERECSGCASCRDVCPFGLSPDMMIIPGYKLTQELNICVLCGLCNEYCASGIDLAGRISAIKKIEAEDRHNDRQI